MNNPEAKYLGNKVDIPNQYSKELLLALPRFENRKQYDICEQPKIFTGYDVWHAYEFSFLTFNGLPIAGMLKIIYPATNLFIVESKSLKLYLNSFNMSSFGNLKTVLATIKSDLEEILLCNVEISFFDNEIETTNDFNNYEKLEEIINTDLLKFNSYTESPDLLQKELGKGSEIKVYSNLLRSNCKVTHQPDWGSVFINIKSKDEVELSSLLQYLVSFRNENHFHEEVCEMIYKRLWDKFSPELLTVACIYTRRGGIDICPVRSNKPDTLPKTLVDSKKLSFKLYRQ